MNVKAETREIKFLAEGETSIAVRGLTSDFKVGTFDTSGFTV